MFQSPGSIALQLGPFSIHWYGILIAIGILLAYGYISLEIKRRGLEQKMVDEMAFWLILAGVLGARLYYVLYNAGYFFENPFEIFKVWRGGLAIHGALLGGALAYAIFTWRKKIPFFLYADVIMPGVLLAQALGRWGNFFNSEAFGTPTSLPWKLFIPEENRPEGFEDFSYFHPTFLYEFLWNIAGFFFLFWLSRKCHPRLSSVISGSDRGSHDSGVIFFSYLIFYSIGRFFIESIRTDSLYFGPFRQAQLMSVILFLAGFLGLIYRLKKSTIKSPPIS